MVVAESDEKDLNKLSAILHNHGYEVFKASDGEQAIALIRETNPDAVVLAINLDNLSGFQVVQQIHDPGNVHNKDIWTVPVLMTAAKVRGRDKQYSISLGVRGYFPKPVQPAQLCSRLEKEVAKYRGHPA